jgi:hypothetical protein
VIIVTRDQIINPIHASANVPTVINSIRSCRFISSVSIKTGSGLILRFNRLRCQYPRGAAQAYEASRRSPVIGTRERSLVVPKMFYVGDMNGCPTDNRHRFMLAALVSEIRRYTPE